MQEVVENTSNKEKKAGNKIKPHSIQTSLSSKPTIKKAKF